MKKRCLKIKASAIVLMLFLVLTSIPMVALADEVVTGNNVRISGQDRYGTSFAVADELHKQTGAFDNVVVAFGGNFPDALSGGYLSKVKRAPLILIDPNQESKVLSYIKSNMKSNGTVYLLGGTGVVSSNFEAALKSQGNKVKRLAGQGRYDTNLEILKEAVKPGEEILVASGANYPDSLSGSAVGKGMLLVGKTLTDAQKNWIKSNNTKKFYILGGDAAVSPAVESELKTMGTVERIGGANRYDTSRKVADRFFPKAKKVALVSGKNFPDGLSGAPIAMVNNAPIILVADGSASDYAKDYVVRNEVTTSITIGGTGAVSVNIVNNVMVYVAPKPEPEPTPTPTPEPTPEPEPEPTPEPEPEPEHTTHSWGEWRLRAAAKTGGLFVRNCTECNLREGVLVEWGSSQGQLVRVYDAIDYIFRVVPENDGNKDQYDAYYSGKGDTTIYVDGKLAGHGAVLMDAAPGKYDIEVFLDGDFIFSNTHHVKSEHTTHTWGEWEGMAVGKGSATYARTCTVCGQREGVGVEGGTGNMTERIDYNLKVAPEPNSPIGKDWYDEYYSGNGDISIYVDGNLSGHGNVDMPASPGTHGIEVFLDGAFLNLLTVEVYSKDSN